MRDITNWMQQFLGVFVLVAGLFMLSPGNSHGLELNGFGDVVFSATEMSDSGDDNNGFALGQLDLYMAEQVSDRIDVLAELVIESASGAFVIDLERLQIGYALDNNRKLRVGRFHNLLGYWNLAYHHGSQLQTSIERPFFLEFEDDGGVIPVHMVGTWWASRHHTPLGRTDVGIMFGNGASLSADLTANEVAELNPDSGGDSDNDKAVSANISLMPAKVGGLTVGASAHFGTINIVDTGGGALNDELDQFIWGLDVVYARSGTEVLAEYYAWHHDTTSTPTSHNNTTAWYTQVSHAVTEMLTPYLRYALLDAEADPYFNAIGFTRNASGVVANREKSVVIAGVRYDLNYRSSLKAEYRSVDDDRLGTYIEGAAQWAFSF
ncbi:MAG: hypothetical protein ACE5FN_05090 [Leptospirillia bacterium]